MSNREFFIVKRITTVGGDVYYKLAAWIIDEFHCMESKRYASRTEACLAARKWEMNQVAKVETAFRSDK